MKLKKVVFELTDLEKKMIRDDEIILDQPSRFTDEVVIPQVDEVIRNHPTRLWSSRRISVSERTVEIFFNED